MQGTGVVVIEPIACVAECETLEGPSLPCALTGIATLAAGAGVICFTLFHRRS